MSESDLTTPARDLVALLAPQVAQGSLSQGGAGALRRVWATLEQRFSGDTDATMVLAVFAKGASQQNRQELLIEQITARFADATGRAELHALIDELRGSPGVRSTIEADGAESQIADSGHKIIAPSGPVNATTRATGGGKITGSPITIVGAASPPPTLTPSAPTSAVPTGARWVDDATLSADGTHFSYGHALLIGVGSYEDRQFNVPDRTTVNDLEDLHGVLIDPQRAAYPPRQVRLLVDSKATRAGISQALDELAARVTPESTALIVFAGHGAQVGDSYALMPHDASAGDLIGSGISAALLQAKVAAVRARAKRTLVILNCCHAGGVGGAVLGDTPDLPSGAAPPSDFYLPLAEGSGQAVISSARPAQKAGARSQVQARYTVFGAHLLDALRGAAPGQGQGIGVFELFTHLAHSVPEDAKLIRYNYRPLAHEPLFYANALDASFAVALRPPGTGGVLSAGTDDLIPQLIAVETDLACYDREADATSELRGRRDALLRQISNGDR